MRVGEDTLRALAYPALVGEPEPGDRVLLNVNALAMGLGTGGYALVVALPDRLPPDPPPAPGHAVKARYTPLQAVVLAADEEASPLRETLAAAHDLAGMPVVTADLHSALPAVLAGVLADRPTARVAYVMTDGGALPAWFSRTLDALAGLLAGVVTVGQAFGGDLEATNLHGGLLAARHGLAADVAIVAQGPGNLGTGTEWGFSGVACGEAVNAAAVLGGRPVGSLRISDADPRPRHRGISHHSLTAYGRVALAPADLVIPADAGPEVRAALSRLSRHTVVEVDPVGLDAALRALPVKLSTMGRDLDADYAYFVAAAAAGRHAAALK
ncbi:hypothetical protein Val02_35850 [Virgisporangium aliadipatigenens]|uniref:DUF3866 family protein n=1 Tax=Virgisporangium aliadipatigenens TaxID=741659 RepID=A0A8J3YJX9_9ACTN|nr:hypothetical protein Val02_35850 [Virgisporangium aliadipatigenens]